MEKQSDFPEKQTWGTWEELLLACAVHRYGTENWDSVAVELQKRSSTLHHLLTPKTCEQKYHDLKRRFSQNDDVPEPNDDDNNRTEDDSATLTIPWLDRLRKLRVAELRREVERYDLSIVSLQLKVKKLTEEHEQSSKDDEKVTEKPDPERTVEKCGEEEKKDHDGERDNTPPENAAAKEVSGEDSDPEYRSCNESNSTDPKCEDPNTGSDEIEKQPEPAAGGSEPAGVSTRPAVEDSFNGSSDTVAKGSAGASPFRESEKPSSERGAGDSAGMWESVAESKEEVVKESNSDVQSSASLPRKKGNEPRNEDQSPAIKRSPVKSQPLVDLLEIFRSHRFGSVFERRLDSQETPNYTSLIRQHIDLQTIRTRLEEGWYSSVGDSKFYRDLLLLFNNAVVFFGKRSSESMAAVELRQIVLKEIARKARKPDPAPKEEKSVPPLPKPMKSDPEPSASLLLKTKISVPSTACRKRSSITAKALASSSASDKKREQTTTLVDDKPVVDLKQNDKSSGKAEEYRVTKKRTTERFKANSRNVSKNGNKGRPNLNANKNSDAIPHTGFSSRESHSENSESKPEKVKKNTTVNANAKKKGAANFLNRMKRCSSSNNGPSLLDTLKSSDNGKGGADQKKNGNGNRKVDSRKDQASRKGSGGKKVKEQESPAKRSVGRPPKKAAAPSPSPAVQAKRGREAGETEAGTSRHSKKRSRK